MEDALKLMRKAGGQFRRSYEERVSLVCRYLHTDATAEQLAEEAEVNVTTFRRWVRELRAELEAKGVNGSAPVEAGEDDGMQARLPMAQVS